MLVIFSFLIVSGGILVQGAHHIKQCDAATATCKADTTCSPLYDQYKINCTDAFLNMSCQPSCLWGLNTLFLNPTGLGFFDCKCRDNDTECRSFTNQCQAVCSPTITACTGHPVCGPLMAGVLSKCNITSTDCNQECWTTYTAAAKLYPIITVMHDCDCGPNADCNRVQNAVNICDNAAKPTKGSTDQASQASQATRAPGTQPSGRTVGPTSTATHRSLAFGALAIGVIAGVLFV
ncbi:multiple epidermal growth factor-like domains protein 6 [Corticium candelabrum]|uniref:multiple epidermal growth factor-like domains protein 6 n=1 Tax=Corticium candelabrum TaxID=121492 RepID=UPI002E256A6C|nr:multiple epidermal growth factor-like domains protein 6 [Corticium candelabrum]